MPGLFRDIIGPRAKNALGRGYTSLKSNLGFGWSALKGDPGTVMGMNQLRGVGTMARHLRPGNIRTMGPEVARGLGRWGSAADLRGQGKLRGLGVASRVGGIGAAAAGADFLNPWGLGWGD
jgi:hypothetical protein